jgi:hypothetical protein
MIKKFIKKIPNSILHLFFILFFFTVLSLYLPDFLNDFGFKCYNKDLFLFKNSTIYKLNRQNKNLFSISCNNNYPDLKFLFFPVSNYLIILDLIYFFYCLVKFNYLSK